MRPLLLSMTAFGPYRAEQTIDFGELGSNRVFLIHGETGAGKTTILDAMVFALYGSTSGGERQPQQMRCESAAPNLATEVIFDFALGRRRFRIKRRPAQQLEGSRSGRTVDKPAEVALWDRTGCAEGEEGRPLATRIREADAQVRELLGFSSEQFRQVVVLPQGKFRDLLASGSDKREEILRQLFRTERFRALEVALSERAKQVRREMEQLALERKAQLGTVGATDDGELAALKTESAARLAATFERAREAEGVAQRAADLLNQARKAEEARQAATRARRALEALEARSEEMGALGTRIERARRAERLRPAADNLAAAVTAASEARRAQDKAVEELETAELLQGEALEALARENSRASEREAAETGLRRLEGLVSALELWLEAAAIREEVAGRVAELRERSVQSRENREQAGLAVATFREQEDEAEKAAAELGGARARLEQAREIKERCVRLERITLDLATAMEDSVRAESAEIAARERHDERQATLMLVEERWKSSRAVVLASELKEGEPCPVCGATVHPAPARESRVTATDQELEKTRRELSAGRMALDEAHDLAVEARNRVATIRALEESARQDLGPNLGLSVEEAEIAVASCRAALQSLERQAQVEEARRMLSLAEEVLAKAVEEEQGVGLALAREEVSLAGAETRLEERAGVIPDELKGRGALEAALAEALRTRDELALALERAETEATAARERYLERRAAADGAAKMAGVAAQNHARCFRAFETGLRNLDFSSAEAWQESLLADEELLALDRTLETYRDEMQRAQGRLQQAELAVHASPQPIPLDEATAAAETAAADASVAIGEREKARGVQRQLEDVSDRLAEIDARAAGVERAYRVSGLLADVAGGQGPTRVSFQRWVLGVYLDEVLVSASRRLYTMSKGRYRLERQRESAGRARPSGLDLAVFDEFSGTSRPAVTLSGGESFLAALALALGLAETVQGHSVGVPLETIFVDEGFGALDADALELALDVLVELQAGGRLVGVISHVPELRQVIPARLQISGGSSGSSARFVVP